MIAMRNPVIWKVARLALLTIIAYGLLFYFPGF